MTPTRSYIHKLNVTRFEALLNQERSAKQRGILTKLLAEEHVLLAEAMRVELLAKPSSDRPA
jgi:hypothetical protein